MSALSAEVAWEQACDALATEDFGAAFDILDAAFQAAAPAQRAELGLCLASLHSLYGDTALDEMRRALNAAGRLDSPLAQALRAELAAREGTQLPPLPGADAEPLARYHTLAALATAGRGEEALALALTPDELPPHLRWRLRSWQADLAEGQGELREAANLYAEAARLCSGENRASLLQEQAALLLSTDEPQAALEVLARAQADTPGLGPGAVNWHTLQAQALLALGRAEEAALTLRRARALAAGTPLPYTTALVSGQVQMSLGDPEGALAHFRQALELAGDEDRPYALHELGVAHLDSDQEVEAREALQAVLAAPDYPYAPEALADLAEVEYRAGNFAGAQTLAQQALGQGAAVPANAVLGAVALEYYHLDEALEHYRQVVALAAEGSREWLTGQQMVADILSQQGLPDPAAAYAAAEAALEHTDPHDEWHPTLQDILGRAAAALRDRSRTLN